jgi:hypothetical protein
MAINHLHSSPDVRRRRVWHNNIRLNYFFEKYTIFLELIHET